MDWYIYYRVRTDHAQALQEKIGRMQAGLAKQHGMAVALKRRPEPKDGMQTWMEVYLSVPDDFDTALATAVAGAQVDALIDGERHTEFFLDLPPCA